MIAAGFCRPLLEEQSTHGKSRRNTMVTTELWGKIEGKIDLPPMPKTVARLRELSAEDVIDLDAVGQAIERDPVLAAKVLGFANSAYFGLSEVVPSIGRAIMTLGLSGVYNIVLQIEICDGYLKQGGVDYDFDGLWRHSILTAQLCRDLHENCQAENRDELLSADELYTCGLLHDLGRVAMIFSLGAEYIDLIKRGRRDGTPTYHLERQGYGYTHTETGAMIAQMWGLPRLVADAIECHHLPRVRLREQPFTIAVAVADEVAHMAQDGDKIDALHYSTNPAFNYVGLSLDQAKERVETARGYLDAIVI